MNWLPIPTNGCLHLKIWMSCFSWKNSEALVTLVPYSLSATKLQNGLFSWGLCSQFATVPTLLYHPWYQSGSSLLGHHFSFSRNKRETREHVLLEQRRLFANLITISTSFLLMETPTLLGVARSSKITFPSFSGICECPHASQLGTRFSGVNTGEGECYWHLVGRGRDAAAHPIRRGSLP